MLYEKCSEVSEEFWEDLGKQDPGAVLGRSGAEFQDGLYRLPFFDRILLIDPARRTVQEAGAQGGDPGFRACLTALMYLLHIDTAGLGPPLSPLDLPGGATYFRGHHGLPHVPLEARFGRDIPAFLAAGRKLKAETRPAGDAALSLQVFPGIIVEVILWQADDEFPAQVSFTLPAHLDRFWFLDSVWGLLNLVAQELVKAAP
jgi:hypothetical protein